MNEPNQWMNEAEECSHYTMDRVFFIHSFCDGIWSIEDVFKMYAYLVFIQWRILVQSIYRVISLQSSENVRAE